MKFITNYETEIEADGIMEAIEVFMNESNRTRAYEGLEPIDVEEFTTYGDYAAKLITDWGMITISKED